MVSLSHGYKFLQIILVFLNLLVVACGVGLVAMGSVVDISLSNYGDLEHDSLRVAVVFVICLGCLVFIVGVLGLCGACLKSACMLIAYTLFLVLLVMAHAVGGVAVLIGARKIKEVFSDHLKNLYEDYSSTESAKNVIDSIQKKLKCCGVSGFWGRSPVPESCMDENGRKYTEGCLEKMNTFIQSNLATIATCVFALALLQVICIIVASCVVHAIRHGKAQTV
ncbi:hypothetical protein FGIG_09690 [Fasciola gigantica]|uniref:Tetraspanin n=1 Tax=Fasciola gigantica TaxID=46835 RepID=A0A504YX02_FASGI|nr:hypothetical protein FGIG_09690 [Fasciola gigantica]